MSTTWKTILQSYWGNGEVVTIRMNGFLMDKDKKDRNLKSFFLKIIVEYPKYYIQYFLRLKTILKLFFSYRSPTFKLPNNVLLFLVKLEIEFLQRLTFFENFLKRNLEKFYSWFSSKPWQLTELVKLCRFHNPSFCIFPFGYHFWKNVL